MPDLPSRCIGSIAIGRRGGDGHSDGAGNRVTPRVVRSGHFPDFSRWNVLIGDLGNDDKRVERRRQTAREATFHPPNLDRRGAGVARASRPAPPHTGWVVARRSSGRAAPRRLSGVCGIQGGRSVLAPICARRNGTVARALSRVILDLRFWITRGTQRPVQAVYKVGVKWGVPFRHIGAVGNGTVSRVLSR
jgi:hypothetical protein